VRQRVWVKRVRLADGQGGRVEVSCLVAREEGAPEGNADLIDPEIWHNHANASSPETSAHADPDELFRT
jgi:hypothetical protein